MDKERLCETNCKKRSSKALGLMDSNIIEYKHTGTSAAG
jgi:hypothetical protein